MTVFESECFTTADQMLCACAYDVIIKLTVSFINKNPLWGYMKRDKYWKFLDFVDQGCRMGLLAAEGMLRMGLLLPQTGFHAS